MSLPPRWVKTCVGNIASVSGGVTKNAGRETQRRLPYLRVANVYADELRLNDVASIGVTATDIKRALLRPGDLLVVEGNGSVEQIGRVAVWHGVISPCVHQNHLIKVRFERGISEDFVKYWLLSPSGRDAIVTAASSTSGLHTLSISKVETLPVLLAPEREQARIVSALDSHGSRLDAAAASLESCGRKLKAYRASVLKAAVEGRLVPTEAELARKESRSYEPADVLLERILKERRRHWEEAELAKIKAAGKSPMDDRWRTKYTEHEPLDVGKLPNLPDGWRWTSLDAFLAGIDAGKNFSCEERPPQAGEFGVVKVSAVTWGTFDEDESKTCTRRELANLNHLIRPGDFLFSRANTLELVGACVIAGQFSRTLLLSDKILRLKLLGGVERWLMWVLRSYWGRREIESLASGNQLSMRNLSQENLRRLRIPVPPTAEIERIVEEIDMQLSIADETEAIVSNSAARAKRLRQAVLKSAFEGMLVDQDPADEPADVLLARIRLRQDSGAEVRAVREAAALTTKAKRSQKLKTAS